MTRIDPLFPSPCDGIKRPRYPGGARRLLLIATVGTSILCAGCDNANVSYGVGFHTGSYGWGNSFSVGVSNHHYRRYPARPVRRGP